MKKIIILAIIILSASCTKYSIYSPNISVSKIDIPDVYEVLITGRVIGDIRLEVLVNNEIREYQLKDAALIRFQEKKIETLILKWKDTNGKNIKIWTGHQNITHPK